MLVWSDAVVGPSGARPAESHPSSADIDRRAGLTAETQLPADAKPEALIEVGLNIRVLWIDDDEHVLRWIGRLFGAQGCSVDCATTGSAGLSCASTQEYDFIGLDMHLPDVSGLSVLRQLRNRLIDTPVFVLTGYFSDDSMISQAWQAGASDCRAKPIRGAELVREARRIVTSCGRSQGLHSRSRARSGSSSLHAECLQGLCRDLSEGPQSRAITRLGARLLLALVDPTTMILPFVACARAFRLTMTPGDSPQAQVAQLRELLQHAQPPPGTLCPSVAQAQVRLELENRQTERVSESALAAELGRNAGHLGQDLVNQTGLTFWEWRKMNRLRASVRAIAIGREHFKQIAYHTGWSSQSQFNHEFVRLFGIPPRVFRDRLFEARILIL